MTKDYGALKGQSGTATCSQIEIITEHPRYTEIWMRERSVLALRAGSSSASQAASVMLNHNDTHRSNFFVCVMVGADYQKQRDLRISRAAICIYYQ